MKIWKLLSAIVVTVALLVAIPYGLETLGLVSPLTPNAWVVLLVTGLGLVLKTVFGDLISGEFEYHKHGYDFCVVTLGATISSLSLQLTTDKDLFPGLPSTGPLSFLAGVSGDVLVQRRMLLFLFLLLSCVVALLTAYISKAIKDPNTRFKNALSLINFSFGSALLGAYVLMLITKG
jgi:hypothetical protein